MYKLRKDWESLDKARELLEDGPLDYLDEDDCIKVLEILNKCETNIRDILSVKELFRLRDMK